MKPAAVVRSVPAWNVEDKALKTQWERPGVQGEGCGASQKPELGPLLQGLPQDPRLNPVLLNWDFQGADCRRLLSPQTWLCPEADTLRAWAWLVWLPQGSGRHLHG